MHKKLTISVDNAVYEGLHRMIGRRRISQFIENVLKPHVLDSCLDEGYQAMAADKMREEEAHAWCEALAQDVSHETR